METQEARDVVLLGHVSGGAECTRPGTAYQVFATLCRRLGNLHGAQWLSVGVPSRVRDGKVRFALRVGGDSAPLQELRGEDLQIGTMKVRITDVVVSALVPHRDLYSSYVVIAPAREDQHPGSDGRPGMAWWRSKGAFQGAVERRLKSMGIQAEVEVGDLVVRRAAGARVAGWPVLLRGLSPQK